MSDHSDDSRSPRSSLSSSTSNGESNNNVAPRAMSTERHRRRSVRRANTSTSNDEYNNVAPRAMSSERHLRRANTSTSNDASNNMAPRAMSSNNQSITPRRRSSTRNARGRRNARRRRNTRRRRNVNRNRDLRRNPLPTSGSSPNDEKFHLIGRLCRRIVELRNYYSSIQQPRTNYQLRQLLRGVRKPDSIDPRVFRKIKKKAVEGDFRLGTSNDIIFQKRKIRNGGFEWKRIFSDNGAYETIRDLHSNGSSHRGRDWMLQKASEERYHIPDIRNIVRRVRRNCGFCTTRNKGNKQKPYVPLKPILSSGFGLHMEFDFFEMRRFQCLMGCDHFSKFGFLWIFEGQSGRTYIQMLDNIDLRFGDIGGVQKVHTDNGGPFSSYETQDALLERFKEFVRSLPLHPWVLGQGERTNGTLKNAINVELYNRQLDDIDEVSLEEFRDVASVALDRYNSSYHSNLPDKLTPKRVVEFLRDPSLNDDLKERFRMNVREHQKGTADFMVAAHKRKHYRENPNRQNISRGSYVIKDRRSKGKYLSKQTTPKGDAAIVEELRNDGQNAFITYLFDSRGRNRRRLVSIRNLQAIPMEEFDNGTFQGSPGSTEGQRLKDYLFQFNGTYPHGRANRNRNRSSGEHDTSYYTNNRNNRASGARRRTTNNVSPRTNNSSRTNNNNVSPRTNNNNNISSNVSRTNNDSNVSRTNTNNNTSSSRSEEYNDGRIDNNNSVSRTEGVGSDDFISRNTNSSINNRAPRARRITNSNNISSRTNTNNNTSSSRSEEYNDGRIDNNNSVSRTEGVGRSTRNIESDDSMSTINNSDEMAGRSSRSEELNVVESDASLSNDSVTRTEKIHRGFLSSVWGFVKNFISSENDPIISTESDDSVTPNAQSSDLHSFDDDEFLLNYPVISTVESDDSVTPNVQSGDLYSFDDDEFLLSNDDDDESNLGSDDVWYGDEEEEEEEEGEEVLDKFVEEMISKLRKRVELEEKRKRELHLRLVIELRRIGYAFHGRTRGEGNCLFHAISDLLRLQGIIVDHLTLRQRAVEWLRNNKYTILSTGAMLLEFAAGFLERGEIYDDMIDRLSTPGEFGGDLVLLALSNALNIRIRVFNVDNNDVLHGERPIIHDPISGNFESEVTLLYYFSYNRLSERRVGHYQSLLLIATEDSATTSNSNNRASRARRRTDNNVSPRTNNNNIDNESSRTNNVSPRTNNSNNESSRTNNVSPRTNNNNNNRAPRARRNVDSLNHSSTSPSSSGYSTPEINNNNGNLEENTYSQQQTILEEIQRREIEPSDYGTLESLDEDLFKDVIDPEDYEKYLRSHVCLDEGDGFVERDNTCMICLFPLMVEDKKVEGLVDLKILPCGHVFHRLCLKPWLCGRAKSCPICRMEVDIRKLKNDALDKRMERLNKKVVKQESDNTILIMDSEEEQEQEEENGDFVVEDDDSDASNLVLDSEEEQQQEEGEDGDFIVEEYSDVSDSDVSDSDGDDKNDDEIVSNSSSGKKNKRKKRVKKLSKAAQIVQMLERDEETQRISSEEEDVMESNENMDKTAEEEVDDFLERDKEKDLKRKKRLDELINRLDDLEELRKRKFEELRKRSNEVLRKGSIEDLRKRREMYIGLYETKSGTKSTNLSTTSVEHNNNNNRSPRDRRVISPPSRTNNNDNVLGPNNISPRTNNNNRSPRDRRVIAPPSRTNNNDNILGRNNISPRTNNNDNVSVESGTISTSPSSNLSSTSLEFINNNNNNRSPRDRRVIIPPPYNSVRKTTKKKRKKKKGGKKKKKRKKRKKNKKKKRKNSFIVLNKENGEEDFEPSENEEEEEEEIEEEEEEEWINITGRKRNRDNLDSDKLERPPKRVRPSKRVKRCYRCDNDTEMCEECKKKLNEK